MYKKKYYEKPEKYSDILTKARIYCNCGHSVNISSDKDKVLCDWCGNYVFKDKKTEFEFRMKEKMNNGK